MKKKYIILTIIIIILLTCIIIPEQLAKIYGTFYMKIHFPKMSLQCTNVEWSKYHDDYIITFNDKDSNIYSCTIGPKYFPVLLGQGLFDIEETYRNNYLEISNKSNESQESNLIKIDNNIITNEHIIDEFISNVKTSKKELSLIINEIKGDNSQLINFRYIPGEKTISEIDSNIISQIYTESETPGIAMEKFSKLYGYYEFVVKSDNETFIKKFDAYNYELVKNNVDNIIKVELQTELDVTEYLILCQYNIDNKS